MNSVCISPGPGPQTGSLSPQPTPKKIQLPAVLVTGAVSSWGPELAASAAVEGARSVGQRCGDGSQTPACFLLLTL